MEGLILGLPDEMLIHIFAQCTYKSLRTLREVPLDYYLMQLSLATLLETRVMDLDLLFVV